MKIELEIPKNRIEDLAIASNSVYWGAIVTIHESGKIVVDVDGREGYKGKYTLTETKIKAALETMAESYAHHFAHFMSEDEDENTGDVFIQLAALGDVIFG